MAKYNKLHNPKKFGFKNKTRGGHRAYIFRDDFDSTHTILGVTIEGSNVYRATWSLSGAYIGSMPNDFDLIPLKNKKAHFDDLTKIDVPFGELDKDTQERLKAWTHGVEYRIKNWHRSPDPGFYSDDTYRAIPEPVEKPKPKYEVGRWYPWSGGGCPLPEFVEHEVLLASGTKIKDGNPKTWDWRDAAIPIIAFKVVSYA